MLKSVEFHLGYIWSSTWSVWLQWVNAVHLILYSVFFKKVWQVGWKVGRILDHYCIQSSSYWDHQTSEVRKDV